MEAMKKHSGCEELQYQCCYTIAICAQHGGVDMSNALQRFDAGGLLLKVLKSVASTNAKLLWVACLALKNVAESSRGNLRSLRKLQVHKVGSLM